VAEGHAALRGALAVDLRLDASHHLLCLAAGGPIGPLTVSQRYRPRV
jgi:hypothetical protein